ncbi:MAG: FtsX-like permease family protein [Bryobacterales bacterium]|nr:FtsX-like permease family protein [Bryobacterales bacterium]
MNFVAWQMLTGDKAKYLGLIFAVAFSTFLMSHQVSIFVGLMDRTRSQIKDVRDASIWVMDGKTQYLDEVKALTDQDLYRIRGVEGVEWAVPLYKGVSRAKTPDGRFRGVILMGLDDATLVGGPRKLVLGDMERLREPDSIIIDQVGYKFFFPDQPLELGKTLDMLDRTVTIVGIANSSAPFVNLPVFYTRYSQAMNFIGRERNQMAFVLVKAREGIEDSVVTKRIAEATNLKASTAHEFGWETIWYYIKNTGIPINFGITVAIAFLVGAVVAGQTFYLFTIENLKQFGALKAIGVTNWRIMSMILLQALIVGVVGYCMGIAMTAGFFEATKDNLDLRGFRLLPEIMYGTAGAVAIIILLASVFSVRRVVVLEPAIVFRG